MRKRRNFSKAQILNHLNGQRESGQTAVHYCATQGVCKSTFFRWRKVHKKTLESDLGKFIELIPSGVQARNSIVEIELPSSCTVRFYQGANNALISEIIRGL
jgi:hypothetical protein